MNPITVLLTDDHAIVRQGLRLLLEEAEDVEVVGEAANGHQSVIETVRLRPDVVLLDLAMPVLNGVEATRQISRKVPSTKVLILSSYSNEQYVRNAIEAGAAGYLVKESAASDLLWAIREVHKGNAFFSPIASRGLSRPWRQCESRPHAADPARLTIRQTEVLQLIGEGYPTKRIATTLSITRKTVEKHRQALMDKLNLHKISALTRYAVSSGVVDVNFTAQWKGPKPFAFQRAANALR